MQTKQWTEEQMGQCLDLKHCIVKPKDMGTKKISAEIFGDIRNVVLEENGKDTILRKSS